VPSLVDLSGMPLALKDVLRMYQLTNSCPGARLVRIFALPVHTSLDGGLIGMIHVGKVFADVLAICFACSIMQIGLLVAKLWC
jgi:hypothetical protein